MYREENDELKEKNKKWITKLDEEIEKGSESIKKLTM